MKNLNLILLILIIPINNLLACTIFTASSESTVLAGNSEDMCTTNTEICFIPDSQEAFGRVMWGFKGDENFQGGMNRFGLFFDGAGTPPVEMSGWDMPEYGNRYIFEVALEKCKNVQEAVSFLKQYSFPYLKFCHILMADATGDAVIVEWGNNKLNFITKEKDNFLIATNFNLTETTDPEEECFRYKTAKDMLSNSDPSVNLFENIFSLTHVEGKFPTVYSNICDLKNQKVYLYNFHNYRFSKEFDLNEELKKGENRYMIRSFFPVSTSESMFRMMNDCIDNFENLLEHQITFRVVFKETPQNEVFYIRGGAKVLGIWDSPGIELIKTGKNTFEKTFSFKSGKLFDFSISSKEDRYTLFSENRKPINEITVEVKEDELILINVESWEKKE